VLVDVIEEPGPPGVAVWEDVDAFSVSVESANAGAAPTCRYFDGWLAKLIKLRDQTCRDPFCYAPIRYLDHITRHADGGLTTFTNGRGACERGNLVREMPGWQLKVIDCGFSILPHKIIITRPTGHGYCSRAPAPP
jgi:hypothetical protein